MRGNGTKKLRGKDRSRPAQKGHGPSVFSSQTELRDGGPSRNVETDYAIAAAITQPELRGKDQWADGRKAQSPGVSPSQAELRQDGLFSSAETSLYGRAVLTQAEIIDLIRAYHRTRCYAMESRKAADLRLGAFLRSELGWSRNKPEAERKAIAAQAQALLSKPTGSQWESVIAASVAARKPFDEIEKKSLKEMERLAEMLPVWQSFGADVRGFGRGSLAVIVAEAGDLANYSNKGKLWKRMGLAVIDEQRQGFVPKGLSREARRDAYIEHGYSPKRRSRVWNIGDALIKGNGTGKYRACYLKRKEYELARNPEMKPIVAHRRAQRYMEKRLLYDLWRAWGRTTPWLTETSPRANCPSPEIEQRSEAHT